MKVLIFAKEILIPAVGKLLCHIYGRHAWPLMTITSHTCAYNIILKANREYTCGMWSYYDANYCQKAEATLNKDWSAIDTSLFTQCFTGRARKAQGCVNCSSLKHDSAECQRKKGKCPANEDIKGLYLKQQKQRPDVCFNWNLQPPHHATTNMNASSASQKSTLTWIFSRCLKGTPSRRQTISGLNSQRNRQSPTIAIPSIGS